MKRRLLGIIPDSLEEKKKTKDKNLKDSPSKKELKLFNKLKPFITIKQTYLNHLSLFHLEVEFKYSKKREVGSEEIMKEGPSLLYKKKDELIIELIRELIEMFSEK